MPSISILVATTGRATLRNLISSVIYQLSDDDTLYVAIDGSKFFQGCLEGDYILHADDDDIYLEDAIDFIKSALAKLDGNTIPFFKFWDDKRGYARWEFPAISDGNIGTPCGAVPNIPERMGTWGARYGGDFNFYKSCKFKHEFIDRIVYCATPRLDFIIPLPGNRLLFYGPWVKMCT